MTREGLPPGPRSALPQLLHMRDPFPYMRELATKYRSPVTVPLLGAPPIVLTWTPEGIRTIFGADPMSFGSAANEALSVILGSGSIFLQSGAAHRRTRKLLAPPFHGERMRAYAEIMLNAAERWSEKIPRDTVAPILPIAQGITLDVIVEAIFGEQDPARVAALHERILAVVAAFNPMIATFKLLQRELGGLGPWARFQARAKELHGVMLGLIEEKRSKPGDDVLSLLVAARDEDGSALSDREIIEQLLTFVIAGHETTATSLAWALYELHRAPDTLARLRAELAQADREGASAEALSKLPYLRAVVDETLRMHPPVPMITRKCVAPIELEGYSLPAGTYVAAGAYNAHCREETFPEPYAFRPERFVNKTFSPFEYLPYGGGHRRCLGAAFAGFELCVVLATLLRRAEFSLAEPKPVEHVFRIGTFGPATGVRLRRA